MIMKKEEKKTEKKVVVSKEKYDKLVVGNEKLVAANEKLEFNNANLEKALCNQKKALTTLSDETLRLKTLIENHNKKWFSRKIKF
jgi:predicted RNase H-like nuclease (RuvC/YqgF family)